MPLLFLNSLLVEWIKVLYRREFHKKKREFNFAQFGRRFSLLISLELFRLLSSNFHLLFFVQCRITGDKRGCQSYLPHRFINYSNSLERVKQNQQKLLTHTKNSITSLTPILYTILRLLPVTRHLKMQKERSKIGYNRAKPDFVKR